MIAVEPALTVPIALDSTPPPGGSDVLVRVIYFRITAEDPNTPMWFESGSAAFPFILLGLEGIVLGPATNQPLFQSPQDITQLIDLIEGRITGQFDELAFETSSIWLPFQALAHSKRISARSERGDTAVERGDVFRVPLRRFAKLGGLQMVASKNRLCAISLCVPVRRGNRKRKQFTFHRLRPKHFVPGR
jgi:hypothetical protein